MTGESSFRGGAGALVLFFLACSFVISSTAYPQCAKNLEPPSKLSRNLTFCSSPAYAVSGCCSPADDTQIKTAYDGLNISDAKCGAFMKQILCSKCDAYSADLYGASLSSSSRPVPYLCTNSTTTTSYCDQLWTACSTINITNSPFEPGLTAPSSNTTSAESSNTLTSFYTNSTEFCAGGAPVPAEGNACFNGTPYVVPSPIAHTPPTGMCLERLDNATEGTGYYLNLVPHPDGTDRVFVNTQDGHLFLVNVPKPGSGVGFGIDYGKPFLDISARTLNKGELGFMGIAFHPEFLTNGRFFVSYDCDTTVHADCKGVCGCSAINRCNLTAVGSGACRYSAIVAEYSVNATGVTPAEALEANPQEIRRIFTYGLPYENHHAGGLWFGPADKFLYYPLGDGGYADDPWNNGQNLNIPLGKMMRLDIDTFPTNTNGLFGNYSIPRDNPFYGVNNTRAEIWAYGLRNPWRCSFDRGDSSYFYCADVGQNLIEEVDLISRGGNYGWRVYEGTNVFRPSQSPGGVTLASSINAIMPIIEYNHSLGISICGGYVSYSTQDACVYGNYIYGDLNGAQWSAYENPPKSGRYTVSELPYQCSPTTPVPCNEDGSMGGIISYGEDARGDIYLLGVDGAYRMVSPGQCNITCTAQLPVAPTPAPGPEAPAPAPSDASTLFVIIRNSAFCVLLAFCAVVWL